MRDGWKFFTWRGTGPKANIPHRQDFNWLSKGVPVYFSIFLFVSIGAARAEEIKTDYFSINFPDVLLVEAGPGRILVTGPNGPYEAPLQFMSIEYGSSDEIGLEILIEDANHTLGQAKEGAVVGQVDCANDCNAYFGSVEQSESMMKVNSYFYIIRGNKLSAAISAAFDDSYSYDEAKILIEDIAGQIMAGRI